MLGQSDRSSLREKGLVQGTVQNDGKSRQRKVEADGHIAYAVRKRGGMNDTLWSAPFLYSEGPGSLPGNGAAYSERVFPFHSM